MALTLNSAAQKVLVLEKVLRGRFFSFREGDIIRLKTAAGQFRVNEEIVQIYDSAIIVKGNFKIPFSDILYIEKVFRGRKANGIRLMVAGGALITITSINNASHNKQILEPVNLLIGGGLAAAGGIWFSLGKRRYWIGDSWKLKVLDAFLY